MEKEKYIGDRYMKDIRSSKNPYIHNGIEIGLPFNLGDVVRKFGKEIIPKELGIYHLFYKEQLVYIGMSKNLRGRLLYHLRDNDMCFDNCLWFCTGTFGYDIKDTLKIENAMIKKFKPALNTQGLSYR